LLVFHFEIALDVVIQCRTKVSTSFKNGVNKMSVGP
jgi:hypothetical protein